MIYRDFSKQTLPPYLHKQKMDEEKRRRLERIDFNLQNNNLDSSSRTASDTITFQSRHQKSMSDALKEVRKSDETIKDNHYLRPDNHSGSFYKWVI